MRRSNFSAIILVFFPVILREDVADLADIMLSGKAQRKGLKSARIGEHRSVKSHGPMQPAQPFYQLIARLQVKMIGIARVH